MRYLLRLAYNGSEFHGWQIQPNAISVQESIENCLSKIFGTKINIVGCGRTDTGVHASDFYAHFDAEPVQYNNSKLCYKLNSMLPSSIAIKELYLIHEDFHARFSATARKYKYHISRTKNPFQINQTWCYYNELNIAAMQEAGALLLHYTDFTSFSKLHTDVKTNICDVMEFEVINSVDELVIHIKANRFLRNMVRAIVGTIIDVGLGKISVTDFKEIIEAEDRKSAAFSAPASGLFLSEIDYPTTLLKEITISDE
jgi:tRNA pseudouridine38-40 synthase